MTALIVMETLAILLLGVLVAGLLRSHAEILRQLHQLGAGPDAATSGEGHSHGTATPLSLGPAHRHGRAVDSVAGPSPAGDLISVGLGRPGERTLLLFLSSGCERCEGYWEALRGGKHLGLDPMTRTVAVARDGAEESCSRLTALAPHDIPVILSSAAWDAFAVPGSPYAVLVGEDNAVLGEGTAPSWERLLSLLSQAVDDSGHRRGLRLDQSRPDSGRSDQREARADQELRNAGIVPGHPSLYPSTMQPHP